MTGDGPDHIILVVRKSGMDKPIQEQVAHELQQHGFSVSCCSDGDTELLKGDVVLMMGAVGSLRRTSALLERNPDPRRKTVMWIFEPLPPPNVPIWKVRLASRLSAVQTGKKWTKPLLHLLSRPFDHLLSHPYRDQVSVQLFRFTVDNFAMIDRGLRKGWLDQILTSTEQKRQYLQSFGISAEFVPIGQQPFFGKVLGVQRDIDVLFIGSLKSSRRRAELDALMNRLRRFGLNVFVPKSPIWGDERTELVNRAKVLLHIHQMQWDTPWMRWVLAAANGAAVASMPLSVPAPMRPNIDFLSAPTDELADQILSLIQDESRRQAMVKECQSTIADHMTCAGAVARIAPRLRLLIAQRD